MKRIIKIIFIVGVSICGILAIAWQSLVQIDFVGKKDPKIVEETLKRWNNILFSAEFREGLDYCMINLLDSTKIEISVGDESGGTFLNEEYEILEDTIVVIGGIKHASKYLKSNKFLIQDSKLLFKIDSTGNFDTTTVMTITLNKIKP